MKKLAAALMLCAAQFANAQLVDNAVPGVYAVNTPNPNSPTPGTWAYDVTVQVVVADQPGTSGTQAALSVDGNAVTTSGSGRVPQPTTTVNDPQTVTLTDASGAVVTTFTDTPHQQTSGIHAVWDTWTADSPVPVGTYTLHVTGTATCSHRPQCPGSQPLKIGATTTYQTLPMVFWWTAGIDPNFQAAAQIVQDYTVISTAVGDASGAQQVCDLYNAQITSGLQAFFDAVMPGAYQVDGTASAAANVNGSWVCTYTVSYQDLVNAPGVEQTVETAQGVVTVGTGSDASQAPQPQAATVRRHDD